MLVVSYSCSLLAEPSNPSVGVGVCVCGGGGGGGDVLLRWPPKKLTKLLLTKNSIPFHSLNISL